MKKTNLKFFEISSMKKIEIGFRDQESASGTRSPGFHGPDSVPTLLEIKIFQCKELFFYLIWLIGVKIKLRIITKIICRRFRDTISLKIDFTAYGLHRDDPPAWEWKKKFHFQTARNSKMRSFKDCHLWEIRKVGNSGSSFPNSSGMCHKWPVENWPHLPKLFFY